MRELQRSLEHNAKLQYFYDIKGQKRTNADLEEREINKKIQQREQLEKDINEYKDIIAKIQVGLYKTFFNFNIYHEFIVRI